MRPISGTPRRLQFWSSLWCSLLLAASVSAQRSANERQVEAPATELQRRQLWEPAVAFASKQFLVVWTEQRITSNLEPLNQVLAARVTPSGEVLDSRGIIVASSGVLRREPRVVASADGFVVFWRETSGLGGDGSRFARVDADGKVLDFEGIELPHYLGELGCAGASCIGAAAPALDVRVLGFDVCGVQNDESLLAIPPRTSSQSSATTSAAHIASTPCVGHMLALAQHDERSGEVSIALAGFALDGELQFARSLQSIVTGGPSLPAFDIAADASGHALLVWQQMDQLWSLWADASGKALGPSQRLVDASNPVLAFDGDGFVLVTGDQSLAAFRLDADGKLIRREPAMIRSDPPGLRDRVSVAATQQAALVVWRAAGAPFANELNAALIDAKGDLIDDRGLAIAGSANRQSEPSLARFGDGYALLLRDDRPSSRGFRLFRLDARGEVIGSSEPELGATSNVQLVAAGDRLALLLSDERAPMLSWIDAETLALSTPIQPDSTRNTQLVPGDDSILTVTSSRGRLCGEDQPCDLTLSLQMLELDGSIRGSPLTYGPDGEWTRTDSIAVPDRNGFVLAFRQARVDSRSNERSLQVVHVGRDGAAERSQVIATGEAYERCVAIAPAEDGYLLVIERSSSVGNPRNATLLGLRLRSDLRPLDDAPFELTTGDARRARASAVHDGAAWWVAWQERKTECSWDVYGARVPSAPDRPTSFGVAVSPRDELSPTLAAASPGHALVAYERFDDDPGAMIGRVFLRDLVANASCNIPACCDDECKPPSTSRCEAATADRCEAKAQARRARYGCDCSLGPRGATSQLPIRTTLFGLIAWARRRRRSSSPRSRLAA
ncbi:MAG TPA: hypothetical protein VJV78_10885 [Polyangiales bacterium]|nr:hypothetical protein [Polyangiales bacterium]